LRPRSNAFGTVVVDVNDAMVTRPVPPLTQFINPSQVG